MLRVLSALMFFFSLSNQSVRSQTVALFNPRPLPAVVTEDAPLALPGQPVVSVAYQDYLFVVCTAPDLLLCVQTRFNGADRPPVLLTTVPLQEPCTNIVLDAPGGVVEVYPLSGSGLSSAYLYYAAPDLGRLFVRPAPGGSEYAPPLVAAIGDSELTLDPATATVRTVNSRTGRTVTLQLDGAEPESIFIGRERAFVLDKGGQTVTSIDPETGYKTDLVGLERAPVQAVFQEHRILALSAATRTLMPLFINDARLGTASPIPPTAYTQQLRGAPSPIHIGKVRLMGSDPSALDTQLQRVRTQLNGDVRSRHELPGLRRTIYDRQAILDYTPRNLRLDHETELHFGVAPTTQLDVALHPVRRRG